MNIEDKLTEDQNRYYVAFPGDITSDQEAALDREGFTWYRNAVGVGDADARFRHETADDTEFYVIEVPAGTPDEASRRVVQALGREPEGLQVELRR